ncbi:hypothetical protein G7Y79_00021g049740 [Physcia stellaris]|nr:hypothetical protein G7Y79_00021g049740 [Physcia stellaris]
MLIAQFQHSAAMVAMRKLKKNQFTVRHNGRTQKEFEKIWKITTIVHQRASQTKGQRVGIITSHNIPGMMTPMFNHWSQNVAAVYLPQHVIGVSAAQYMNLLASQVASL